MPPPSFERVVSAIIAPGARQVNPPCSQQQPAATDDPAPLDRPPQSLASRRMNTLSWEISGSYLEACNCEAICPCRRIGGRPGGRSTYGECLGALSWIVEEGRAGDVDLAHMRAVLASRYHDDEPGSPWTFALFVDAAATSASAKRWPTSSPVASAGPRQAVPVGLQGREPAGRGGARHRDRPHPRARLVQGGRQGRGPRARACARSGDGDLRDSGPPPPRARALQRFDRGRCQPVGVLGPGALRL